MTTIKAESKTTKTVYIFLFSDTFTTYFFFAISSTPIADILLLYNILFFIGMQFYRLKLS